ncbi:hypothetical protein ACK3TF_001549 [Chlorella vulgaris]
MFRTQSAGSNPRSGEGGSHEQPGSGLADATSSLTVPSDGLPPPPPPNPALGDGSSVAAAERRRDAAEQAVLLLHQQLGKQQDLLEDATQRAIVAEQALAASQGPDAPVAARRVESLDSDLRKVRLKLQQVAAAADREAKRAHKAEQELSRVQEEARVLLLRAHHAEQQLAVAQQQAAQAQIAHRQQLGRAMQALSCEVRELERQHGSELAMALGQVQGLKLIALHAHQNQHHRKPPPPARPPPAPSPSLPPPPPAPAPAPAHGAQERVKELESSLQAAEQRVGELESSLQAAQEASALRAAARATLLNEGCDVLAAQPGSPGLSPGNSPSTSTSPSNSPSNGGLVGGSSTAEGAEGAGTPPAAAEQPRTKLRPTAPSFQPRTAQLAEQEAGQEAEEQAAEDVQQGAVTGKQAVAEQEEEEGGEGEEDKEDKETAQHAVEQADEEEAEEGQEEEEAAEEAVAVAEAEGRAEEADGGVSCDALVAQPVSPGPSPSPGPTSGNSNANSPSPSPSSSDSNSNGNNPSNSPSPSSGGLVGGSSTAEGAEGAGTPPAAAEQPRTKLRPTAPPFQPRTAQLAEQEAGQEAEEQAVWEEEGAEDQAVWEEEEAEEQAVWEEEGKEGGEGEEEMDAAVPKDKAAQPAGQTDKEVEGAEQAQTEEEHSAGEVDRGEGAVGEAVALAEVASRGQELDCKERGASELPLGPASPRRAAASLNIAAPVFVPRQL